MGAKPARPDAPLPDSPEALPFTARTPESSTPPMTRPAAAVLAVVDAASPEEPATQSSAGEEATMAAEGLKQLLLVIDGRPYTLLAENVMGLVIPDVLAGEQKPLESCAWSLMPSLAGLIKQAF